MKNYVFSLLSRDAWKLIIQHTKASALGRTVCECICVCNDYTYIRILSCFEIVGRKRFFWFDSQQKILMWRKEKEIVCVRMCANGECAIHWYWEATTFHSALVELCVVNICSKYLISKHVRVHSSNESAHSAVTAYTHTDIIAPNTSDICAERIFPLCFSHGFSFVLCATRGWCVSCAFVSD